MPIRDPEVRRQRDALRKRRARAAAAALRAHEGSLPALLKPIDCTERRIETGDVEERERLLNQELEVVMNVIPRDPLSATGAKLVFQRSREVANLVLSLQKLEDANKTQKRLTDVELVLHQRQSE